MTCYECGRGLFSDGIENVAKVTIEVEPFPIPLHYCEPCRKESVVRFTRLYKAGYVREWWRRSFILLGMKQYLAGPRIHVPRGIILP